MFEKYIKEERVLCCLLQTYLINILIHICIKVKLWRHFFYGVIKAIKNPGEKVHPDFNLS